MVRLLRFVALAPLAAAQVCAAQADAPGSQHFTAGLDLGFVAANGNPSWTEGSVGKLRYDDSNDGVVVSRAFVDYRNRLTDTVDVDAAVEIYDDDLGDAVDFTEAYLRWRPVPRSPNRYRVRAGVFYPDMSLENSGPGWGNPYLVNSSAINTWIAEELRTVGVELSISRRPLSLGGRHRFGIEAALFRVNDPTGSLLAWKGWSVHDRQSRWSDELPLAPLPLLQPGNWFQRQDPYVAPFREVDGRTGFYAGAEWRFESRFLLKFLHYDNQGNPEAFERGQYAWETIFDHVAVQAALPDEFGVIAQWIRGTTAMGYETNGRYPVEAEFDSWFVLLTRPFGRHRLSVRYDDFGVTDEDGTPDDSNAESGAAWTLGYRYSHSDDVSLAVEWLRIRTTRDSWTYFGLAPSASERQLQVELMIRFSG